MSTTPVLGFSEPHTPEEAMQDSRGDPLAGLSDLSTPEPGNAGMGFKFGLQPLNPHDIPVDTAKLVLEANALVESITTWRKGKVYTYDAPVAGLEVPTFSTILDGEYWCARVSHVNTDTYPFATLVKHLTGAEFKEGEWVIRDRYRHTESEGRYIQLVVRWRPIQWSSFSKSVLEGSTDTFSPEFSYLQDWICVNLEYRFGSMLSNREFNEFILVTPPKRLCDLNPDEADESLVCFVISLVANYTVTAGNVHAAYCSVERLKYDPQTNQVEWAMATCSDARGNLPRKLQRLMAAKAISHDVPSFLQFLNALRKDEDGSIN
ncbi:unnamed protein product [Kuraishia capsulata CBS 1993]|uniref:DUF3074 domain-containing protein n=1 Tax=Kuraishia capsulata CBS 1993 TaxID=1382522 RepID=W6MN23_9ASCO|nr:uncharacterized protein KUCA_T00003622001 [Kuraishia capsulata CBS 1993]CDK27643.1 unnamed protein product [Kuraishia capsulata CBS 1993]